MQEEKKMMEACMEFALPEGAVPELPEKRCYTVEDLQNILMCGRNDDFAAGCGKLLHQAVDQPLTVEHKQGFIPAHAGRLPSGQNRCRKIHPVFHSCMAAIVHGPAVNDKVNG